MTKHGETVRGGGDLAQPSWNLRMVTPSKGVCLSVPFPQALAALAVHSTKVRMASWAVKGPRVGPELEKDGSEGDLLPRPEENACLMLRGEVPCAPGAGDRQAVPGSGPTCSLQPPFTLRSPLLILPSPVGLA